MESYGYELSNQGEDCLFITEKQFILSFDVPPAFSTFSTIFEKNGVDHPS